MLCLLGYLVDRTRSHSIFKIDPARILINDHSTTDLIRRRSPRVSRAICWHHLSLVCGIPDFLNHLVVWSRGSRAANIVSVWNLLQEYVQSNVSLFLSLLCSRLSNLLKRFYNSLMHYGRSDFDSCDNTERFISARNVKFHLYFHPTWSVSVGAFSCANEFPDRSRLHI